MVSRLAVRRKKQTKCNFLSKPFRYVHSNYISLMVMVVAATYSSACNEPLNYFIGLIFLSFFHFLFVNAPLKSIANDFVYSGHFMIMIMLFFQYNYPVVSFTFIYFASLNTSVYRHLYNTENMCNTKCLITFFLHSLQSQIKWSTGICHFLSILNSISLLFRQITAQSLFIKLNYITFPLARNADTFST